VSASDDLPRGWTIQQAGAAGVQLVITVPAVPGISHVLTGMSGYTQLFNGSGPDWGVLNVTVGGLGVIAQVLTGANTQDSGVYQDIQTVSWTGMYMAPTGVALVVIFASPGSGWTDIGLIEGYDI
jgi:hypothetical protein